MSFQTTNANIQHYSDNSKKSCIFFHIAAIFFSDTASFSLLAVSITEQFPFYYNSAKFFFALQFFNELCRILPSDAVITFFPMFYYSTLKIFFPNNKKRLDFYVKPVGIYVGGYCVSTICLTFYVYPILVHTYYHHYLRVRTRLVVLIWRIM